MTMEYLIGGIKMVGVTTVSGLAGAAAFVASVGGNDTHLTDGTSVPVGWVIGLAVWMMGVMMSVGGAAFWIGGTLRGIRDAQVATAAKMDAQVALFTKEIETLRAYGCGRCGETNKKKGGE